MFVDSFCQVGHLNFEHKLQNWDVQQQNDEDPYEWNENFEGENLSDGGVVLQVDREDNEGVYEASGGEVGGRVDSDEREFAEVVYQSGGDEGGD